MFEYFFGDLRYFILVHFSSIFRVFWWFVNYFKIKRATFPLTRVSIVFRYVIKPHVLKNL